MKLTPSPLETAISNFKIWMSTHIRILGISLGSFVIVVGQLLIFSSQLIAGAAVTIFGGLVILISWLAELQILHAVQIVSSQLKKMAAHGQRKADASLQPKPKAIEAPREVETMTDGLMQTTHHQGEPIPEELTKEPAPVAVVSPWQQKLGRQLTITRIHLMLVGIAFFIISQPFFLLEKYWLALLFILPSLGLLGRVLFLKKDYQLIVNLKTVLVTGVVFIPGIVMMLAGNIILLNIFKLGHHWEWAGLGLNGLGILLIYYLMPRHLKDPDPSAGNVLDCHDGHAHNWASAAIKVVLVLLSLIMFIILRVKGAYFTTEQTILLLAGILVTLFLSFPWKLHFQEREVSHRSDNIILKGFRLVAFALALYLGYKGQLLMSQEQLVPGLYRFFWAGLALIMAFQEPSMQQARDDQPDKSLKWYWELLVLVVLLGVGTWLRVYLLDSVPYGVECDEAGSGWAAMQALYEKLPSVIVAKEGGRPLFMLMPKVISFALLGVTAFSLKIMSALWGVLGIAALYLMARHMFSVKAAMGAAALLVFSRWQIHFSRYGWSNTLMILLLTIGFYFLLKGLDKRKKSYFFLSGLMMSLTVQTETAARLLPLICAALLVYLFFSQHRFLYRNWKPMVVLMLGVWLGGAGIFAFWIQKPEFLIKRVQEVSIFSEDVNAPRNLVDGLLTSAKLSMTQLNWHGDYRPRHNGGLSGEPVLDFWTAILFALGFVFSLYYWKKLRYFILLIWFFGFMAGSVMSLEAPQSHRAFGLLPAAFLLIAGFLDHSRRLLAGTLGRWGVLAGSVAFIILLWPVATINYHKYFDTQPAFDGNCSAAAKYMGSEEWKDAQHYVMSAYLWMGHPPFKFYAPKVAANFYYQPSHLLPNRIISDKDVLYTAILEYQPVIDLVKWFYPEGEYQEEYHEKYGMMFRSYGIKREHLLAKQGLTARYYTNKQWSGKPVLVRKDADMAASLNRESELLTKVGSIAWEGTFLLPHEGEYTFFLTGRDQVEVKIGSRINLQTDNNQEVRQTAWLPGGLQRFRAKAKVDGANQAIRLAWKGDTIAEYLPNSHSYKLPFAKQDIPLDRYYVYPKPIGLLETMYGNDNWQGPPLRQTVEPLPFFFWHSTPYGYSPPLSFDWQGFITIPESGRYRFEIPRNGYSQLRIGDQIVLTNGQLPQAARTETRSGRGINNPIDLEQGTYPIKIRWSARQGWAFKFWWTKPDGNREIVPGWLLSPAEK